jgi:Txe/YoeB family toxin of Txe-Axe toxin-antitoxin module
MPTIIDLRADIQTYLRTHGLLRKWEKAKALFENDPSHPSLNTELLEPKHRLIYSFRLDNKHRAIFIRPFGDTIEIIAVTKHYRK